jgi:hypothetical protein
MLARQCGTHTSCHYCSAALKRQPDAPVHMRWWRALCLVLTPPAQHVCTGWQLCCSMYPLVSSGCYEAGIVNACKLHPLEWQCQSHPKPQTGQCQCQCSASDTPSQNQTSQQPPWHHTVVRNSAAYCQWFLHRMRASPPGSTSTTGGTYKHQADSTVVIDAAVRLALHYARYECPELSSGLWTCSVCVSYILSTVARTQNQHQTTTTSEGGGDPLATGCRLRVNRKAANATLTSCAANTSIVPQGKGSLRLHACLPQSKTLQGSAASPAQH